MYSSLHKLDIVAKDPQGTPLVVQTDHRGKDEIDGDVEISVLFALTRTLLPKRTEYKDAKIRYVAMDDLHPAIARVCVSTGAEVEAKGTIVDLSRVAKTAPADLADEAFASLGKKALAREGLSADEQGLVRFEATLEKVSMEEDEIRYWTNIAELAAVTGEVLRAKFGGRWVDDPQGWADMPFMFQIAGDSGFMNPVGKAVKFFLHGASESPRFLFKALEDRGTPDGPLLVNLKPSTWGGRDQALCEIVEPTLAQTGADLPIVVYGHDHPNTFAMMMKDGKSEDMSALRREVIANLSEVEVRVERVDLEGLTFWVTTGSYFAAEKILDVSHMKKLHEMIGSELLAAAIPEKGQLLVMNAMLPQQMPGFMAIARGMFDRNEGGRQISPTVFLVQNGSLVGVAQTKTEAPAPTNKDKKKGFFARLFH